MPDAVKISELPSRAAVLTDILPAIDANYAQTVRLTAQDIAALGGGPPGDNTVSTPKLINGAVTYPKIQNVTQDRILGRASSGAGVVEEIPCTPFARSVLAAPDSATAVNALGALASTVDPTFTGAVKIPSGTAAAPSLAHSASPNTGLFFPVNNIIGFAADGYERFRIGEDGAQYANYPGTDISTELRQVFSVRAYAMFNGTGAGSFTIANQHTISQRYRGQWGSLLSDNATKNYIKFLEENRSGGNPIPNQTISNFSTTGTEGRDNYTTPQDNVHWRWNGSTWVIVQPATGLPWIGSITITSNASVGILNSGNISSITRSSAGVYDVAFVGAMPDANYCVVATPTNTAAAVTTAHAARVVSQTTTGFRLTAVRLTDNTNQDVNQFAFVVLR